jgi:hypothetical protein
VGPREHGPASPPRQPSVPAPLGPAPSARLRLPRAPDPARALARASPARAAAQPWRPSARRPASLAPRPWPSASAPSAWSARRRRPGRPTRQEPPLYFFPKTPVRNFREKQPPDAQFLPPVAHFLATISPSDSSNRRRSHVPPERRRSFAEVSSFLLSSLHRSPPRRSLARPGLGCAGPDALVSPPLAAQHAEPR